MRKQWQWLTLLGLNPSRFLTKESHQNDTLVRLASTLPSQLRSINRTEFYKMLDSVHIQSEERFNQPDLDVLQKLEETLLTGEVNDIVDQYPELNRDRLKVQLAMFRSKYTFKSSAEVADIMRGLTIEVRGLFDQVKSLVRLLLVIPVSSAEAERSFSALRRLKTWLRTTMTQV